MSSCLEHVADVGPQADEASLRFELQALGRSDDEVRSSLRFGLGRFNTLEEVQYVVEQVPRVVRELKQML